MSRRMFLVQEKVNFVPGKHYCYMSDGMLDLDTDMRCATCRHWDSGNGKFGDCGTIPEQNPRQDDFGLGIATTGGENEDGIYAKSWFTTRADFGCVQWEAKE